jgi:geranylgeranyl reductase family protein
MKLWDTIVVGAGPAGCAAAYDLAHAGREVLLLDRAEFPRQKACAGGLTTKTLRALRYPVDPVIRQRLKQLRIERDADRSTVLRRRADYCFMTVRKELDDYCYRRTLAAGAQFQRIRGIATIREDAAGVEVIIDSAEAGAGQSLRARYLIGADGVHSQVRQLTHGANPSAPENTSEWFWRAFALEANVRLPEASQQDLVFDFAPIRDGYGWIFPKGDHVNIGLYSYSADEKIDRARLAAYIRSRYGDAQGEDVIGQYAGFGAGRHKISATRVFLVGDAGGFADPLTGEGIYFAVVSGQAAAEAIGAALQLGTQAYIQFQQATEKLRTDLALSTSGARWFYDHLDQGYRYLSMPLLQGAALRAFAEGLNLSKLAHRVRKLRAIWPGTRTTPDSLLN